MIRIQNPKNEWGRFLEFQIQNLRIVTRFKGPQKADDTVLCHNNLLHRNLWPIIKWKDIFSPLCQVQRMQSTGFTQPHPQKYSRTTQSTPIPAIYLNTRHWFSPTLSHDSQRPVSLRGASSMTVGPSDRELVHRKAHPTLWLVNLGGHVVSWVGPT